jgi:hypothetical protein
MSVHEVADNRARRRDLTCATTGLFAGGGLGTLTAALLVPTGGLILVAIGAALGGVASTAVASRISVDDWDPRSNGRTYVGTRCPDDDVTAPSELTVSRL